MAIARIELGITTGALLTAVRPRSTLAAMDEEDDFKPGQPIVELGKEDLDPLSIEELDQRVARLRAEIDRVESHKARVTAHRSAADELFKR